MRQNEQVTIKIPITDIVEKLPELRVIKMVRIKNKT